MRWFVALVVLVAIVVGIFSIVMPRDQIIRLIVFRDFFDVSLPILGFGALVKYLASCNVCCNCKK